MIWSEDQIKYLTLNYPLIGKKGCVKVMKLKECQIRYMASKLGLKVDLNSKSLNYNKKNHFKGVKRPNHSLKMKAKFKDGELPHIKKREKEKYIKQCKICGVDIEFTLPKNSLQKYRLRDTCSNICYHKLLSLKLKESIKIKGHPKGMKGKTHSDEIKADMSKRVKKMWKDKSSKVNSEQNKQRISDNNVRLHKIGVLGGNNSYSNCKRGWFVDKDKKYYMRSGWELRYAAYLNILKKSSAIKDWEYEVDTFWFYKIKRGVRSYKPDFKIWFNDTSFEYHEVKGWLDNKSKTKLKRMKIYYPNIDVKLKGAKFFKDNNHIIPSYDFAVKNYSR